MKTVYALLIAALFTTAACKGKEQPAKVNPAAKSGEPAKPEAAKVDPAASAEPTTPEPKAEPTAAAAGEPAAPASAGSKLTVDEAGTKALALADKFAKVIAGAGEDCTKVGAGLKSLTAEIKESVALEQDFVKDEAKQREFSTKYEAQVTEKMKGTFPVIQKCMENPDVKGVLQLMGE